MTILFIGGEIEDFATAVGAGYNTSGTSYRSTYARGALQITGATSSANYVKAAFTASSQFSVTARVLGSSTLSAQPFLHLLTGGSARLRLKLTGAGPSTVILESVTSGGAATTLATSTLTVSNNTLYRLDLIVDYQVAGRVRLYVDQTLYIDYSGDVTASSATSLDGLLLATMHTGLPTYWSEVIVSTQDSRSLSLVTLAPNAAGTTTGWTSGAYTDIDEQTAADSDVITSATANQVFQANLSNLPTTSGVTVTAVKMLAYAARGASGPSKLSVGVRTNSTDSQPTSVTLDTGYGTAATYYQTNPVTSSAWTTTEADALQISLRSET